MGCWNATCFVTRLPISHLEAVRWFLVGKTDYGEFYPLTPGFPGKYDDYGTPFESTTDERGKRRLKSYAGPGIAVWQQWLNEGRVREGEGTAPDWARKDDWDLATLGPQTDPEVLLYRSFSPREAPLIGPKPPRAATGSSDDPAIIKALTALENCLDMLSPVHVSGLMCHEFVYCKLVELATQPDEYGCDGGASNCSNVGWANRLRSWWDTSWWASTRPDGELIELAKFNTALNNLRRSWRPQDEHDGSQTTCLNQHYQLLTAAAEYAKETLSAHDAT